MDRLDAYPMEAVAHIHTDFPEKFGIPRQSGLVDSLRGEIVFTPKYRNADALRGIEGFSHLWLVWVFSQSTGRDWSPTVRPPRLGGNARMGVFATRSPFRPNPIGLSCVRLEAVEQTADRGTVLRVAGADLLDGTPILDIKPYLPYADCHPDALGGWTGGERDGLLEVRCPEELLSILPADRREALAGVLANDPRPRYQTDPGRIYGLRFAGCNVRFTVEGGVLTVAEITPLSFKEKEQKEL